MTMRSKATVTIPGTLYAEYEGTVDEGQILRLTWMPSASDAGYFGPAAFMWDTDDAEVLDGLDIEDTDGPFWKAVQHALEPVQALGVVLAQPKHDRDQPDSSRAQGVTHRVPIDWRE